MTCFKNTNHLMLLRTETKLIGFFSNWTMDLTSPRILLLLLFKIAPREGLQETGPEIAHGQFSDTN